jgi:hypothetical protein
MPKVAFNVMFLHTILFQLACYTYTINMYLEMLCSTSDPLCRLLRLEFKLHDHITLIYKISLFLLAETKCANSYVNWAAEHENDNENASLATVFE